MKNIGPSFLKVERKDFEWCHVCGQRYTGNWAELWISKNAEHGHEATPASRYVRICGDCTRKIAEGVEAGKIMKTEKTKKPPRGMCMGAIMVPSPEKRQTGGPAVGEKWDYPDTMKKAFIKRLAEYFVVDQAKWSIKLSMASADAKTWAELRNLTPLRGYPTLEEAEKILGDFLR